MLTGRPSAVALLSLVAGLSFHTMACSQAQEETAGDSQEISADALLAIDPSLPFEVTRVHVANGPVLGAHWGAHNGPVVTAPDLVDPTQPSEITRWYLPASPGAPMLQQPWTSIVPETIPTTLFWTADGFVDLPFGNVALQSYTGLAEGAPGEVFLFTRNFDHVIARAHTNGFYSGVGITDGTKTRIVYSGLSGFTAEPTTTQDNGVWASDITASSLVPATPSTKLFGWAGFSGPVVLDNGGNLFVAARRSDAEHKTALFALAKEQTFASEATTQSTVAEADTEGTASLAVASVPGSGKGWVFAKGYDSATAAAPLYARAYKASATAVESEGEVITEAIKAKDASTSLSAFGDPSGNLWVSISGEAGSWLVQLSPKQAPSSSTP